MPSRALSGELLDYLDDDEQDHGADEGEDYGAEQAAAKCQRNAHVCENRWHRQILAGGGTYMYEGLTDKLFGGRYKGRLVLP